MTIGNKDELISVRKAAEQCGRHAETVRRWIQSGKLPAEKQGNQLFIRRNNLDVFCREKATQRYNAESKPDFLERATALQNRIKARGGKPVDAAETIRKMREERTNEIWEAARNTSTALGTKLPVGTSHKLIIGNAANMEEIPSCSVHLMVTSPPYFNAPFDYQGLFKNYNQYLNLLCQVAAEVYRVLQNGRVVVLNIDDMLVNGEKFPIVADATRIFLDAGFRYRDRILWKKPDGYLRISRRSGVILQNPYPMYFYPDNLLESIVIFQKGKFDYRSIPKETREASKIDVKEFSAKKWYMTLWEMNNVMPGSPLEKDIAAFPAELPYRAIKLFSYKGETILDPFAGSGTTMKVARDLERNSIGIEINEALVPIVKEKLGFGIRQKFTANAEDKLEIIKRKAESHVHIC